jgi:hypothetical protein
MDSEDPMRDIARRETELPKSAESKSDIDEDKRMFLLIDSALPTRAKLRTDSDEPSVNKSNTEKEEPSLEVRISARALPNRPMLLNDIVAPT